MYSSYTSEHMPFCNTEAKEIKKFILTKDMQAASNKILTSKSSNCSITSSSKVFPAICNKAI